MNRLPCLLFVLFFVLARPSAATNLPLVNLKPADGESAIQAAIDRLGRSGGGQIALAPGTYELRRGLQIRDAKDLTIHGQPGAQLVLAGGIAAIVAADAVRGATAMDLQSSAGLEKGMRCEVQAPAHSYQSPDGKSHVCPHFDVTLAAIDRARVSLTRPLQYPVPKGSKILHAYNAITISGPTAGLTLEGLDLDLRKDRWPVAPLNHTLHCGVFAGAAFDYKKGVIGEPIREVHVRNCRIRNSHHRGVAWYGVVKSTVVDCQIDDAGAEGIDIDHFCFHCQVRGNQVRHCPVGIELNDPSDCLVVDNRIEDVGRGINLWRWCEGDHLNVRNVFRNNRIARAKGPAIFCGPKTRQSNVIGNQVEGCQGVGIHIAGDENRVEDNQVRACKTSVLVTGDRNTLVKNRGDDGKAWLQDRGKDNRITPGQ